MTSGIYMLLCEANHKYYVGSSCNLKRRWRAHILALRLNRHANRHLQSAWNKYGQTAFSFMVLQEVEPEHLIRQEIHWIERMHPEFNLEMPSKDREGFRHSVETRQKISEAHKGRGYPCSEETKRKVSIAQTGRRATAEARLKMSLAHIGKKQPHSAETRRKIGAANKGKTSWLKGKTMTEEHRQILSAANMGKKMPPVTDEARRHMSEAQKKRRERENARVAKGI